MKRREFMSLAASAIASPFAARAQQAEHARRVGVLMNLAADDPEARSRISALQRRLQELGWVEQRNIAFEIKYPDEKIDNLSGPASQLVESNVDVIVGAGTPAVQALQKLTKSIPLVIGAGGDPVGAGLVDSLSRPGGNITGFSLQSTEVVTKRLELMREIVPSLARVAFLWNHNNASIALQFKETEAAAGRIGIQIQSIDAATIGEIEAGILAASKGGADAVFATSDATQTANRAHIAALAIRHKLPLTGEFKILASAGALFTYGPHLADLWRRAGEYVDRILRGEKPADLPVQQPTRFELVINLKTAKALGLTLPPTLLARADEVIE
jgi:putative ABC transport system substrate-binding protein